MLVGMHQKALGDVSSREMHLSPANKMTNVSSMSSGRVTR